MALQIKTDLTGKKIKLNKRESHKLIKVVFINSKIILELTIIPFIEVELNLRLQITGQISPVTT